MKKKAAHNRSSDRPDDANAFFPDPSGNPGPLSSADAEAFGEEFIGAATGAESVSEDAEDEVVEEEDGGPFIVLDANGQLPPESRELDADEAEPEQQREQTRGARWVATGA